MQEYAFFGVGVIVCLLFIHNGRKLVKQPDQLKRFSALNFHPGNVHIPVRPYRNGRE